jgi:Ala-tRNA(Pro) deacylase
MDIQEYLADNGVKFEVDVHEHVYTAQEVAASEHVTGHIFAKPVIVAAGEEFHMLVVPASRHVDMRKASDLVGAELEMATEGDMKRIFPDCEIGAEPPFGSAYGLKTYVDESLMGMDRIVFRAGDHDHTITIALEDFARLESPTVGQFAIAAG